MTTSRPHVASWAGAPALVLLVAGACTIPEFQGPQIQNPPPAFTMNASTYQDRRMFPERDIVHHDAWVEASWGNFSGIYINGHAGALGPAEVEAAREAAVQAAAGALAEFGEVEELEVDGRTAYGWGENWRLDNGGLEYVVFRAAVSYDTVSYAIDFMTGDPGLKNRPDSLRTVVASFAVGETTWNLRLMALGAGGALLLLAVARARARARSEAARRIRLVQVPKKQGAEAMDSDTVAGAIARKLEEQSRSAGPEGDGT
jgi:hypothetical protein